MGAAPSSKPGGVGLVAKGSYIVAIDLGGTNLRVALADTKGELRNRLNLPTQAEDGPDRVIGQMVEGVRELTAELSPQQILGIGVGAPGPLDPSSGVVFTPPNLPGWRDVPLKALLERELSLPVYLGNDANLAALGEHRFGAGRGLRNLVYLTISTGIGVGVIVEGQLLLGEQGLAGEAGHMTIDMNGPPCKCGNVGCLEALASGLAIARRAQALLDAGASTSIPSFAQGGQITAEAVEAAARGQDPVALEIMAAVGDCLGVGVLNLIHLFNPQAVIIGGGVSNAGELLFQPIRRIIAQRAMPNFRQVQILPAALGEDVGLYGAVALVLAEGGCG
jgi:glucokinase